MKRHIKTVVGSVVVVLLLAVAFLWESSTSEKIQPKENNTAICHEQAETDGNSEKAPEILQVDETTAKDKIKEKSNPEKVEIKPEKKLINTEEKVQSVPEDDNEIVTEKSETSMPSEPIQEEPAENNMTCFLAVRCDTILDNIENLDESKTQLVPPDGKILEIENAVIYEGESVSNLLSRQLRKNGIHFEFTKNPVYNSVYIEGIGNLYERDCGELSGWMYKVNGKIPVCGCSQYILKDGDKVEFLYSCNMGEDI